MRNLDLIHLWGFFFKEPSFRGDVLTPCRVLPRVVFLHDALRLSDAGILLPLYLQVSSTHHPSFISQAPQLL